MKENWTYKKLGEVCEILNGFAFKSDEYKDNGIRVMRITNVQKGAIVDDDPKFFPLERMDEVSKYILREGDVLMSLTGNVGRVGIITSKFLPAALNQRVACLRLRADDVNKKYLFHILNSDSFEKDCIFNAAGIAQKNMSTKWLEQYAIPVPPIETQSRIVSELDLLQSIIDKQQAQLKELDKLAQAVFYDMFGDPVENEKGWETAELNKVCDVRDGTHDSPSYYEEGYPLITSKNVIDGKISFDDVNYICKEDFDNISKRSKVDDGDIIMPMIGTIGKPVIVKKDREFAIKNVALIKFIPNSKVINVYIQAIMSSKAFDTYMRSKNRGGNQKFIALGDIRKLNVQVPPLSLQQSFAAKIESIEKQESAISQSIAETQKLFNYTMDKYFG